MKVLGLFLLWLLAMFGSCVVNTVCGVNAPEAFLITGTTLAAVVAGVLFGVACIEDMKKGNRQ